MKIKNRIINLLLPTFMLLSACAEIEFPQPQVQEGSRYSNLASTTEDGLLMSWFEPLDSVNMSIKFSEFSGGVWTKPSIVKKSRNFFVNWADSPSIFQHKGDTIVLYWPEKSAAGTYDYNVNVAVSVDRGSTWNDAVIPHRDNGKGEHGFLSFYNDLDQKLSMVWLDGRNMSDGHDGDGYGEMNLYLTSFDQKLELEQEMQMDIRVCECCPTAAVTTDNAVLIAYRDRSHDEIRNINILRYSAGEWEEPYAVHNDNWKIAGCPVNGPALEVRDSNIGISWFTAGDETARVLAAFSDNEGKTFGEPLRIDAGNPLGRVDLIWLDNETILVSWIETGAETTNIMARALKTDGFKYPVYTVSEIDPGRVSGNPKMGQSGNQVFFTWTESSQKKQVASKWIGKSEFLKK